MWLGRDLLAAAARLAGGGGLGSPAPDLAGSPGRGRPDRLGTGEPGQRQCPGKKGGTATGPNPTDRGKPGTKRHVIVATAKQLTNADAQQWGALVYHETAAEQTWAVNNGVETGIYSEDGTEFTLASPEGIEAIQWLADLTCEHGAQPPWSQLQQDQAANQLFAGGRVGMMFSTLGLTTYLRENVTDF